MLFNASPSGFPYNNWKLREDVRGVKHAKRAVEKTEKRKI